MTKIDGCIDPGVIHAPSLKDLNPGDKFLYQGLRYEYEKAHENGVWHWTRGLDYPYHVTLWNYNAEVDWLDN